MRAGEKEGELSFYTLGDSHNYVHEFQKRKETVAPAVRRREGAKYTVSWTPEWMNMEPVQKFVDQVLSDTRRQ